MGVKVAIGEALGQGESYSRWLVQGTCAWGISFPLHTFCLLCCVSSLWFFSTRTTVPQTYSVIFLFRGCVGWSDRTYRAANNHLYTINIV
jgi:hypothetical protein